LPLERQLAWAWPEGLWGPIRVLVAVSGGADSVALLRAMQRLAGPQLGEFSVAHFNHGLRGETAAGDEQFVVDLARTLGLDCHVGRADLSVSGAISDGIEATARAARYEFLIQTAERLGARYVVTGHTADDQAETVLHHILRGTGMAGLAGMPRVRVLTPAVTLLRPLLNVRRSEVIDYLATLGQSHREDESNVDRSLTRNRIRHELLPLLTQEYSESVVASLLRLGYLAGDAQQVIESLAEALLEKAITARDGQQLALDCRFLLGSLPHLVREVFVAVWRQLNWPRQGMGFEQWELLANLALDESGVEQAAITLPGAIRAQKTGEQLVLSRC
jgi:tRNA(Ile)-lysidine synthase